MENVRGHFHSRQNLKKRNLFLKINIQSADNTIFRYRKMWNIPLTIFWTDLYLLRRMKCVTESRPTKPCTSLPPSLKISSAADWRACNGNQHRVIESNWDVDWVINYLDYVHFNSYEMRSSKLSWQGQNNFFVPH